MKLTRAQKLRFKALFLQKKEGKTALTPDETQELATLETTAKAENFDPEKSTIEPEDSQGLTEDEVQETVVKALKSIGLDEKAVTDFREGLKGGKSLTSEDLATAIQKHLGGNAIDQKALVAEITKAVASTKGVSKEDLDKTLTEFSKNLRTASKHEFPTGSGAEFPIEHRTGNLTVGQKQLLNICLMNVTDEALTLGKSVRPKGQNDGITNEQLEAAVRNGKSAAARVRQEAIYGRKAITAGGAGTGAELVNTDLSSDLLTRLYLESAVAAEFVGQEIQMPSNPFKLPMTTTRPVFKVGSEGGAAPSTDPGTAAPTLTAGKLIGMSEYSYEAEEDAIIAILPMLQEQLGSAAADALEGALINGDTTSTHQDSDIAAVSVHSSKLFKGFRKYAIAGSLATSLASGGITAANIGAIRKSMGKYGIRPRDLVLIVGPKGYNDILLLPETLTAEKVGSNIARILTGEAATLFGIRILTSSQCREDLNASYVFDNTTTTKGSLLLVHKPSWLMGIRSGFSVETFRDVTTQTNKVVASFRRAFQPKETPSASIQEVALGGNYTA